jgi:ABC-type nickel/cobalt efflux system permease component RcnA
MVVVGTALSLAVAYGWLAGFARQADGDLSFQWRWPIPLWTFIGLASTVYFWRAIWPSQNRTVTRKDIVLGSAALLLPGLWWVISPLRSLSGQHAHEVIEGLVAAALVLTFGAWMIIHLARSFEAEDAEDLKNLDPDTADKDSKK